MPKERYVEGVVGALGTNATGLASTSGDAGIGPRGRRSARPRTVPASEISEREKLAMTLRVNDEVMPDCNTSR